MTWWMLGLGTPAAAVPADNAPSLWSGGVRWGDPAAPFGDGTDAYWASPVVPVNREGFPRLAVAIAGGLVLEELRSADWSLGRSDWLSTLTPSSASFDFIDRPGAVVNDTIVVGLMSDSTQFHSDALWVGRVDAITTTRDVDGVVTTSISATDVIGILGQATTPETIEAGHTLVSLTEALAEDAGMPLEVDTDPIVALPTLNAAGTEDEPLTGTMLDLVNRAERSSNALLFLRGSGRLYAAVRDATGAGAVPVIPLDGDNSPSSWSESTSLQNVVTRWKLAGDEWETDTEATTLETWGEHTFSATDLLIDDPVPYADLIASDVMANPRPILVDASFPIRDMAQKVLYLDPLDRVSSDGDTWQVMSVRHNVTPIRVEDGQTRTDWRMSITADATQDALVGAPDPGPVIPPTLNTITQTYTSIKSAFIVHDNSLPGGSDGVLYVGEFLDGLRYESAIEWAITWPTNTVRVSSATVRLSVESRVTNSRVKFLYIKDSWTEGGVSWGELPYDTKGSRSADVDGSTLTVSITNIAERWRTEGNHGVKLMAVNSYDPTRRASFYSDDASSSLRPVLTLVLEVVT